MLLFFVFLLQGSAQLLKSYEFEPVVGEIFRQTRHLSIYGTVCGAPPSARNRTNFRNTKGILKKNNQTTFLDKILGRAILLDSARKPQNTVLGCPTLLESVTRSPRILLHATLLEFCYMIMYARAPTYLSIPKPTSHNRNHFPVCVVRGRR